MIYDPNARPGNTRSAYHQTIGKSEEGPLGDPHACWKVKNERWATNVSRVTLVLEESQTLLTIWEIERGGKQKNTVNGLFMISILNHL